jgi:hypothetical protein
VGAAFITMTALLAGAFAYFGKGTDG